jgi:extradiol dioxygenase family protein
MTAPIAGYAHVNLCVLDVEVAREFYEGKLGLEVLPRPDFGGGFGGYWFKLGNSQLHLSQVKKMPDWNDAFPHMAIYIPSDEFESAVDDLKSRGVDFFMDVRYREDFGVKVKTAFAKDPSGNVIEMTDVPPFN